LPDSIIQNHDKSILSLRLFRSRLRTLRLLNQKILSPFKYLQVLQ
jgi:hypothetical protein